MNDQSRLLLTLSFATTLLMVRGWTQGSAPSAAGCYLVQVGAWNRRLGEDTVFHAIPHRIVLDTAATASPNARRLSPNIAYPYPRVMRGLPYWTVDGNTLRLVWSDGFAPTIVTLKRSATGWRGTAEAKSDVVPFSLWPWRKRPRAPVELRAQPCP